MNRATEEARVIISSVCENLERMRQRAPAFAEISGSVGADSLVLLTDATQLFCRAVSERFREEPKRRWSDMLPEFLLIYPERCEEILGLIEQESFEQRPYFEAAGLPR